MSELLEYLQHVRDEVGAGARVGQAVVRHAIRRHHFLWGATRSDITITTIHPALSSVFAALTTQYAQEPLASIHSVITLSRFHELQLRCAKRKLLTSSDDLNSPIAGANCAGNGRSDA